MNRVKEDHGFTIIEIVLVILILLVVAFFGYQIYQVRSEEGSNSDSQSEILQVDDPSAIPDEAEGPDPDLEAINDGQEAQGSGGDSLDAELQELENLNLDDDLDTSELDAQIDALQ